jgi:hypothetical protein
MDNRRALPSYQNMPPIHLEGVLNIGRSPARPSVRLNRSNRRTVCSVTSQLPRHHASRQLKACALPKDGSKKAGLNGGNDQWDEEGDTDSSEEEDPAQAQLSANSSYPFGELAAEEAEEE